jgi:predicted transcriptional regulator
MHVVWKIGKPVPARAVHRSVIEEHAVALHTVTTVLNKMVGEGLLCRNKQDEILHYRACVTEAEFRKQMSRRAVEGILSLGLQAVAASFVDVRSSFLSSRHIAAKSWTAVSRSATAMVAHATSTSCIRLPRRKVPPDRVRSLMAVCTSASGMLQSNLPAWSAT